MRTDGLTVFEYMEDFDNPELDECAWRYIMLSAVFNYNEEYGTNYNPYTTLRYYLNHIKYREDV